MGSASTMMMASAVASTAGIVFSIQAQRSALQRENTRLERESKIAQILASNIAFQSAAGYYDDSRSFLNINKQAVNKAHKDLANIRLQGQIVQSKYRDTIFENDLQKEAITFGGYTSAMSELTTGYAMYKYYS